MKKEYFYIVNDLMFKMNLSRNLDAIKVLATTYIKDLNDCDLGEIKLGNPKNLNGIHIKNTEYDLIIKTVDSVLEFEMQNSRVKYNLEDRMLKYYVDLIHPNFKKDETYYHEKCYSLWFVNYNLYKDDEIIHTFKLKDEFGNILNKSGSITVVEIEKFKKSGYNTTVWDRLFLAKTKDDLEKIKGADVILDKVINTMDELNNDFKARQALLRDRKKRNIRAEIEAERQEARQEGRQEGHKVGLEEGRKKQNLEISKNAKKIGLSIEQIIKLNGLTEDEIKSL